MPKGKDKQGLVELVWNPNVLNCRCHVFISHDPATGSTIVVDGTGKVIKKQG